MPMRVLLLADASFARREQPMLSRLEVGLAGEGVRVVLAVPQELMGEAADPVCAALVGYEPGPGWLTRRGRTRRMVEAAAAALEAGGITAAGGAVETPADVIHCFGESAWGMALEAARLTGAGVALEVWSAAAVERARELTVERAGREGEPAVVFLAASEAIATALGDGIIGPVLVARWGVHVPAGFRVAGHRAAEGVTSAAVLVDGRDNRAVLAALEGLGQVARTHQELLVFFDADAEDGDGGGVGRAVWKRAKGLRMRDRLSMVGSMEQHREPILHVDMLIQPEAVGAHHSLTLEAMAGGTIVVARRDPLVESLVDGRTAVLVENASAAAWAAAIQSVLGDPEQAARLRESARTHVREMHPAAGHVGAVMRGYEAVVGLKA